MEQKFVKFEEVLEKLGISADQLNDLRARGVLRAYRDGSSWKFRSDEIAKMAQEGIPEPPPPSDIGIVPSEDLVAAEPLDSPLDLDDEELALEPEDDDTKISKSSPMLKAQDDSALDAELGDTDALSAGSELEFAEMEDTVTAGASDVVLEEGVLENVDQPSDPSDSILLSEEELGESVGPNASTIIGKSELEGEDADLELALDDDDDVHGEQSDEKSASPGASDVLSSKIAGSGVLDSEEVGSGGEASAFENLEELEIDLAAESSRILSPEDVERVQAASQPATPKDDADLRLDEEAESIDDDNMGSTDVPMLDMEGEQATADEGSDSEIDLSDEGGVVLSDSSGSDITLDSGDSGINLVAPSDSGLALDDIPLDIGGSAILSSLSLGGDSDPEISLVADSQVGKELTSLQTDDDFQLTPLSEAAQEADGDSSSQVIALDADIEELGESAVAQFDEVDLTGEADDAVVLTEDFGAAPAGDLGVGYAPSATAAAAMEFPYSVPNVLALSSVAVLLLLAGVMMLDMVWSIWSWQEPYSMSSSLLDALLGIFGMN